MNQPTLLEKARQGDDEAIASVLNYLLKDRNITAQVAIKGNRLLILLKSAPVPEQESSVAVVNKLMKQLSVESINSVEVYGKEIGQKSTAWSESLDLTVKAETHQKLSYLGKKFADGKLKVKEGIASSLSNTNPNTLIISLIPLVAVGIYFGSKLPQLNRVNPSVPVASQSPLSKPSPSPIIESSPIPSPSPVSSPQSSPIPSPSPASSPQSDVFREAVNKAISAAQLTQSAKSKAEWNQVASEWESAIALMKTVPESSQNYALAQKKAIEYQGNLEYANRAANLAH